MIPEDTQMEDRDILALLNARDEAALRETKEKYGPYCLAVARNVLGGEEDAEECLSDVLLRVWNAVPPAEPRDLRAYLAKVTRSIAIDRLRAGNAAKRGGGEAAIAIDELAECVSGNGDAESEVMARALGEAVDRFLRRQKTRDRALFVRRYFFAESNAEIAKRFGMRENSVAATLSRMRRRLRDDLEKEGFTP